ncbi:VOC family protein [Sediminicurvatus halobius]|uniref:VOC domain-containing protein n=1 Tax=Sediminicurvatus halobius TaxID=2182432 RepID=A0A2U2N8J5_9GAMM|nr:VOC family protein [Spiribacter halobius]PWG65392.1 hypothetical protein DEM34_01215 [Spiribacter halobius]UEX76412.1 VOC family protein [Spiribacter halobius]
MTAMAHPEPGGCCWIDLAAADAGSAAAFYSGLFGWEVSAGRLAGGDLLRLEHRGRPLGSIYQLDRRQLEAGAPSHWTPYIAVDCLEQAILQAEELGGRVLVRCFEAPGQVRVGLVMDPVGALIGLWEPAARARQEDHVP